MRIALPAGAEITVTTATPETVVVPNAAGISLWVPTPGYNPGGRGARVKRTATGWHVSVQLNRDVDTNPWGRHVEQDFADLAEAIAWGVEQAGRAR